MFCNSCGRQVPESVKFCPGCGKCLEVKAEPVKAEKKPLDKKKWIPFLAGILAGALVVGLIFGVVLLAGGGNAGSQGKIEGACYNSAADADKAYLNAMKAGNVKQMVSCFAIESYVDNYDSAAQLNRMKAYSPGMELPIAPSNQWLKDLKISERQAAISKIMQAHYQTMSGIYEVTDYRVVSIGVGDSAFANGQELVDLFTDKNWEDKLADMKIGKVLDEDFFLRDLNEEVFEKNKEFNLKTYGCDKLEEVAVRVEFDGEDYLFFFCAGRYNGKWYLVTPSSTLSAMSGVPAMQYGCIMEDEIY